MVADWLCDHFTPLRSCMLAFKTLPQVRHTVYRLPKQASPFSMWVVFIAVRALHRNRHYNLAFSSLSLVGKSNDFCATLSY